MLSRTQRSDTAKFLSHLELFKHMDEQNFSNLVQVSFSRRIPKGYAIFIQDEPASFLYILRSGAVVILLTSSDGREMIIHEINPGEFFGELAIITGYPHSTTAVAQEDSEVIYIAGEQLQSLMKSDPCILAPILGVVANRLYFSNQRESALAFLDAPARLARVLRILDEQSSDKGYISISQTDLARRTGLTRQTVAKNLSRWRRAGWLLTGRGRTVLLNQAELRKIEQEMIG